MKQHIFVVNEKLPSLNEYINACRKNAHAGGTFKRQSDTLIAFYIRKARLPKINKPVCIDFEWHEKTQKRDLDNVAGYGHKTILDALVLCGILKDDSPRFVKGFSDSFTSDKSDYVKITITELD